MPSPSPSAPKPYRAATPFLTLRDPAAALEFYGRAFGAVETLRLLEPGGSIAHAEMAIGEARFMLGREYPELGFRSAETLGGSPVAIHLDVDAVDSFVERARAAGATVLQAPKDEFHGARAASLRDPFGLAWLIATPREEVSPAEMQRRLDEMMKSGG